MANSLLINLSVLFDQPTGIAVYARNVIAHWQSLNPTLLSAQPIEGFRHYPVAADMTPAQGSKGHFKRLLWNQFQLPQIYQELEADLLFSPIPEAPLFSRCRYVVMCHDLIPLRFPRFSSPLTQYFRFVVPLVLRQAEHIICNSQATATDIVNFYGISASKVTPILLGYDAEHFYPRQLVNTANTALKQPYFLYIGRQDSYKNIAGLIDAFAAMGDRNYLLAIAGSRDPRFTPQLKQQAAALGVGERVIWLDYLSYEDLPVIISGAIALVFPTFWEGFGLTALEAMACGTPVITSNLASLPEIIGEAGILIDPYDNQAITAAMNEISQDRVMRSQLSQASLKQAHNFSWAKTAADTKKILEQC